MADIKHPNGNISWIPNDKFTIHVGPDNEDTEPYDSQHDSYYAKTAYTGMTSPKQHYATANDKNDYVKNRFKRLCWIPSISGDDYIANVDAISMYQTKPDTMDTKGFLPMRQSVIDREHRAYQIEYFAAKHNLATPFYFLAMIGYTMSTFGMGILLFGVVFLGYFVGLYSTWSDFFQYIAISLQMGIACFVLWKASAWIAGKLPDNKYIKLNRRTGMACFPQRGKKPDREIPFAEFEPRYYVGTSQGGCFHRLLYVHRSGKPIFSGGQRVIGDVYTRVAYIEQFMDITKPLPDIPPLEWCRDKDPTTAAYDKATGRDPNYWRKKSSREIQTIREERRRKIESIISPHAYQV